MPKRRIFTDIEINGIIDLYKNNKTIRDIYGFYKTSYEKIVSVLKENNILIRDSIDYISVGHGRKYYCNEDVFEKIDSHDKAYWLGFLLADGCVHSSKSGATSPSNVSIALQEGDFVHLHNFLKFIESDYNVKFVEQEYHGKQTKSCRASVYSKKMAQDLINVGCIPRKSLVLEYPKNIDEEYFPSLLSGYFDGDGCLTFSKSELGHISNSVGLMGSYAFLFEVSEKLKKYGIESKSIKKKHGIYFFNIANKHFSKFYNLVYGKSDYFLERKRNKFRDMLDFRHEEFIINDNQSIFRYLY
jgi:hypothetical protein